MKSENANKEYGGNTMQIIPDAIERLKIRRRQEQNSEYRASLNCN